MPDLELGTRYALVASLTPQLADALLPDNYCIIGTVRDGYSVIAGIDNSTWRLDSDVLPRVEAAGRACHEIGEAEATALLSEGI
jgi:hypothetical protein